MSDQVCFALPATTAAGMWPRVGSWVALDTDGFVTQCALADLASRCVGWSVAQGTTLCGRAYLQGSYLCGACAKGFFLQVCFLLLRAWHQ